MILAFCLQLALATTQVQDPVDLDKLAVEYVALDLPVPPSDAPLVMEMSSYEGRERLFGYQIAKLGSHTKLQIGAATVTWDYPLKPLAPKPENVSRMGFSPYYLHLPCQEDIGLATAAIEHLRGHDDFARTILEKSASAELPADPFQRLYELATEYWCNAIVDPAMDRAVILTHLKKLATDHPTQPKGSPSVASIIQQLELTINERQQGTDSIEIAIDDLSDSEVDGTVVTPAYNQTEAQLQPIVKLLSLGFTILPDLAKHVNDQRLTRAITRDPDHGRFGFVTVGQMCLHLLSGIVKPHSTYAAEASPDFLTNGDWLRPFFTRSERESCKEGIKASWNNGDIFIRIAEARCPDLLEELYVKDLEYPSTDTTEAIANGIVRSYPRAKAAGLLVMGARNEYVEQCDCALKILAKLDKQLFEHELLFNISRMSTKGAGSQWFDNGRKFANLVTQTDSSFVWKALLDAAMRGDAADRVRVIQGTQVEEPTAQQKALRLQLLAHFVNDPGVVESKSFEGEVTRRDFVQDEAIDAAARELGMPELHSGASDSDRAAFRAQVRSKLRSSTAPR